MANVEHARTSDRQIRERIERATKALRTIADMSSVLVSSLEQMSATGAPPGLRASAVEMLTVINLGLAPIDPLIAPMLELAEVVQRLIPREN